MASAPSAQRARPQTQGATLEFIDGDYELLDAVVAVEQAHQRAVSPLIRRLSSARRAGQAPASIETCMPRRVE